MPGGIDEWKATRFSTWERWDWEPRALKVNNARFSMENERLVVQNAKSTQTHELKRSVTQHDSDGVRLLMKTKRGVDHCRRW